MATRAGPNGRGKTLIDEYHLSAIASEGRPVHNVGNRTHNPSTTAEKTRRRYPGMSKKKIA